MPEIDFSILSKLHKPRNNGLGRQVIKSDRPEI